MLTLAFPLLQIQACLLIFVRVAAIIFVAPPFDSNSIPITFRAGLAFTISLSLLPMIPVDPLVFDNGTFYLGLKLISEIGVGIVIGLAVKMFFAGVQLAGQVAGYQMGFALANVMDPATSAQIPILSQIKNLFAVLIFLSINAHHMLFQALVESFNLIPPFDFAWSQSVAEPIIKMGGNIFVIAVKIGAPIIAAMLLTSAALGLVARTVPQMNIFIVAMPLKIVVGLLFLGFTLPFLSSFIVSLIGILGRSILEIMQAIT
jgi:flagellar biosynthetic protein FliR